MRFQPRPLTLVLLTVALASVESGAAQSAGAEPVRGPFWSGTVRGKGQNEILADKGIVVTLGADKRAYVCYDTDLMRLALAWTGDYLEFGNTLTRIEWPPPPQAKGDPVFGTRPGPGWARDGNFADPRPNHQGPLPKDWAHYRGLYVHGDDLILSYTVGDCEVLEMPGVESSSEGMVFTRLIRIGKSSSPLTLLVCETEGAGQSAMKSGPASGSIAVLTSHVKANDTSLAAGVRGAPEGATWESADGRIVLKVPALTQPATFQVAVWNGRPDALTKMAPLLNAKPKPVDLAALCTADRRTFRSRWSPKESAATVTDRMSRTR